MTDLAATTSKATLALSGDSHATVERAFWRRRSTQGERSELAKSSSRFHEHHFLFNGFQLEERPQSREP